MSHAKYPPSKLKNWDICPGYESSDTGNAASEEGTMLHKACETGNFENLSEEQKSVVQLCLDYVRSLVGSAHVFDQREVKVSIPNLTWGTCDRLLTYKGGSADLIDYKFGRNPVDDASINLQGFAYVCGAFEEFPETREITVHFLLPRRNEISSHKFERKELPTLLLRIKGVIEKRKAYEEKPSPEALVPDTENCLYCARKATCEALQKMALKVAPKYDVTFELPTEFHPSQITDPKQMAIGLAAAQVLGEWAKSFREHGTQMAKGGTEIPGWVLKHRPGKLDIPDVEAAFVATQELVPELKIEEFLPICSVNLTNLVELVRRKAKRGTKEKMEVELKNKLVGSGIGIREPETSYLTRSK